MRAGLQRQGITLRRKILVLVLVPLLLLGTALGLLAGSSMKKALLGELAEKGRVLSRHGADMTVDDVLTQNRMAASIKLRGLMAEDRDLRYALLLDGNGEITSHSFDGGIPPGLADVLSALEGGTDEVALLMTDAGKIYDVSSPLLGGELGSLHIGLSDEHVMKRLAAVRRNFVLLAALLLLGGGAAAYTFSLWLTRPLAEITAAARRIGGGDLQKSVPVRTGDELGVLATTLNDMAANLQATMVSRASYQQQKRFLDNIFRSITYPFFVIDAGSREVILANAAFGECWEGKTCLDLARKDGRPCGEPSGCPLNIVRETGEPVVMEHVRGNGSGGVHEVHCHPVLDDTGKVTHLIEYLVDITDRKEAERKREELVAGLRKALAKVKTLTGLLPVCAACKKIRDDEGSWQQMEKYVSEHSDAEFSHGICPDCSEELYGGA